MIKMQLAFDIWFYLLKLGSYPTSFACPTVAIGVLSAQLLLTKYSDVLNWHLGVSGSLCLRYQSTPTLLKVPQILTTTQFLYLTPTLKFEVIAQMM